jgi:hypothetical protein
MTRDEIQTWLCYQLAAGLRSTPEAVDVNRPFDAYGMGTREAELLARELEDLLGSRIDPATLRDHDTIGKLSAFLARSASSPLPGGPPAAVSQWPLDDLLPKLAGKR